MLERNVIASEATGDFGAFFNVLVSLDQGRLRSMKFWRLVDAVEELPTLDFTPADQLVLPFSTEAFF